MKSHDWLLHNVHVAKNSCARLELFNSPGESDVSISIPILLNVLPSQPCTVQAMLVSMEIMYM